MPRPRVLSFMSQWGGGPRSPSASYPSSPTTTPQQKPQDSTDSPVRNSPKTPREDGEEHMHHARRRSSMIVGNYQPPVMEMAQDTPPELQPIFSFLNSHSNKLYQEGYFLKLHDLDSRGRPSGDRAWVECFAQLAGTVLSLWDAADLDAAGEDGEVIPSFINLTDASIKMIESLPMNGPDGQSLQNVLSISTAANNRYLLHFNSLHSLTQWTAGIRLAMFEHSTLQEAYTGSIIAGKGKHLNNIRSIMERARFPTEDWARVRFGAGTPWRRCWCIITPPAEKEVQKVQKANKKRSAYERPPAVKGDIKFYDHRKITKKSKPIATVQDAYCAYALYPQSRPLIDQSTLCKLEGQITIHSSPETTTEGFVFVMPEVHPAVTGFEMLIRWLLPVYDTFALYGRPNRLIADKVDPKGLMFAMPDSRRYGYLDLIDVAGLIHTEGSERWPEREWRKQMKQLTAKRMSTPGGPMRAATADQGPRGFSKSSTNLPSGHNRSSQSLSAASNKIRYADDTIRSSPNSRRGSPQSGHPMFSAPPSRNASDISISSPTESRTHQRAVSDAYRPTTSSRLSFETPHPENPPPPPPSQHSGMGPRPPQHVHPPSLTPNYGMPPPNLHTGREPYLTRDEFPSNDNSDVETPEDVDGSETPPDRNLKNGYPSYPIKPPERNAPFHPVATPPNFQHKSNAQPPVRPNLMPDLRRANSAIDTATLAQLADANRASSEDPRVAASMNTQRPSRDDTYLYTKPMPPPPPPHDFPPAPFGGVRRGPPATNNSNFSLPDRSLPTIPGGATPAVEQEAFEMAPENLEERPITRERSPGTISRKPVPSRSPVR